MTRYRRFGSCTPLATLVLLLLLLLGACVPAGAATETAGQDRSTSAGSPVSPVGSATVTSTTAGNARTIDLTQELQLTPRNPGEIAVTKRYSIPGDVVELNTRVPTGATVTSRNGFVQRDGDRYVWDRQTPNPSLTYRKPVNETLDATGPIAGKGDYVFVDTGEWAMVRVPSTPTRWSWTGGGTVGLSRTTTVDGPGAVGDRMAFLGEHREVTRTAHGQTFRLVVPARASLVESPREILDSVATASSALQVGDRDESVFMVAAPTKSIRWGVRGLQTGQSDFWVRDGEALDTADNVWLHEYVHTRQGYAATNDVRWFTEASATYYAALLTLEQDRIGFDAFRDRLTFGSRKPDADAVLADPTTWNTVAPYTKGALVAGELDRRTRRETDRSRSLQDVFGRMNGHGSAVNGSAFRRMVRETGGGETASLAERYTTTEETPPMWNQTAHSGSFDGASARIGYALPEPGDPSGYRVSGPYRDGQVGGERPLRLAVGETLAADVRVTNTGGAAGEYDARLLVNGELRERQTGRLGANESRTLTFTYPLSEAGEYTLAVGGDRVALSVRKPATPRVTGVSVVESRSGQRGRRGATVTANVQNDHSFPAAANLTLYHNGAPVEIRRVELAPGEERSIRYEETLVAPGDHVFRVDDRSATLSVRSSSPREHGTNSSGADGFGVVPALLALAAVLVALGRHS